VDLTQLPAVTYPAEGNPWALLILAHGAGAGQQHPFMVTSARGLAARGVDVVTFDFPYMAAKRGAPDRPPVLERAFREAVSAAQSWSRAKALFIGGKSMGGRMATHLAAEGLDGLAGIVVLGYPLHPPGKPQQLRVAHLPAITAPLLIVQGERDVFGSPAELAPHVATMKADVTVHAVQGGDHSLIPRSAKGKRVHDEILDVIAAWMKKV
jgi:predicted alpha/beta-hydrolase family hydrolase